MWISSLIAANDILPEKKYLNLAEEFFLKIEKKYLKKFTHSYSKDVVFIEDYAFLINALNDLSDKTMNLDTRIMLDNVRRSNIRIFFRR